jgi:hypothetical protein
MLQPQAFDKVKILRYFYDIRKQQHRQGYGYVMRFQKAAEKAIQENYHKEIAHIRPDKAVVQVKGNQKFNHKQQYGNQKIRFIESEHKAWAFEKVLGLAVWCSNKTK